MNFSILFFALLISTHYVTSSEDNSPSRIHFKSGGSILGTIVSDTQEDRKAYVVIRTSSGSMLKVEKSRVILRVSDNSRANPDYQEKLKSIADTPDDHWEMYTWCKENSSSKYSEQIDYHLRRITALDPSDEKAWQLLNFIEVNGRWVPEEQHYLSRGYVKHKGRWVSKSQLEFDSQVNSSDDELAARKKALRNWEQNTIRTKDYATIRSELFDIVDEISLVHFTDKILKREENVERRLLYIEAIGRVENRTAQQILIRYAMEDNDSDVRERAMLELEQEQYNPIYTTNRIAGYLKHADNNLVNRAGDAIAVLKQPVAIIPLISALVTRHKFATGNGPGRVNTQFNSAGGTGLSTGGPESIERDLKNESVLEALRETTGQKFGYDAGLWREWYILNRTVTNPGLRGELDD